MKTSTYKMIAVFAAASLFANVALAKNGGILGGNSGNKNSGFKISFGGGGNGFQGLNSNNNKNNNNNHNPNNQSCHNNGGGFGNGGFNNGGGFNDGNNGPITDNFVNLGRAFEPAHSSYVAQPGDSFFEVALKEYGSSIPARFIAQFNNLPTDTALAIGQTVALPSISSTGKLSASRAPAAEELQGSQSAPPVANFGTSSGSASSNPASTTPAVVEAPRPKVTVGSTLLVDGQTFGDKQGTARLQVGGAALKIEVVEWAGSSVKIRLPQLDLASVMNADIEVVRADGSLAAKTPVELGAATEVALTK